MDGLDSDDDYDDDEDDFDDCEEEEDKDLDEDSAAKKPQRKSAVLLDLSPINIED